MAFNYTFTLNGEPLDATIGVMVHDKLEEAMDENAIHLPITTYNFQYKIMGLLQITATDGAISKSFNFIVISDEVNDVSKDGFYSHNLVALEYTHKLDKFFLSALTFTNTFSRSSRAPFEYLYENAGLFPEITFKETYFTNENIVINQQPKARVEDPITNSAEKDVYLKTNLPLYDGFDVYNLGIGSYTFNTGDIAGDYYFLIGTYIDGIFTTFFKHYIRVIKERKYSLYDMIERVRAVVPIERESFHEQTRIFELDSNLENTFRQIEMPQMFFHEQSARQVLNIMFKYINAISRLQHVDGVNDILTVDFFNKTGTTFDEIDITSFNTSQDAQNFGSKAISFLTQALQSNFRENPSVQSPASERYKTVRSSDIQLTDISFELKLEKPIYELSKLTVVIPIVEFKIQGFDGTTYTKEVFDYELDLTPRTLEKTFWDLKSSTVDILTYNEVEPFEQTIGLRLNKNGNIYWEKNSNVIKFNTVIGSIIKNVLINETIQEALNEDITIKAYDSTLFGVDIPGIPNLYNNFPLTGEGALIIGENMYRNYKFNIEYSTLDNTVLQVDRSDLESVSYESYLRINNPMAVSDYNRVSRDFYGKLERSSMPNKVFTKVHTDMSTVLDVGQIDADNFIITERKLIFHNEFIEGIYTATKNHNRLNEFNGINQEFRVFEIPSFNQTVKRMDFYSDYIFIVKPTEIANTPYLETDNTVYDFQNHHQDLFSHINNPAPARRKATYAIVRTDGFLEQYPDATSDYKGIMTPVVSFGGKGGLNFNFKFDSNLIAGDALIKSVSDDNNIYNSPIWYTDSQGFFDKLWFGIGYDYNNTNDVVLDDLGNPNEDYFNEEYGYPLIRSTSATYLGQPTLAHNGPANNPDWFIVYKDQATNYGFSYHLAIMPLNFEEYVIGQNFYTENPTVANVPKTKYLYVYDTLTPYNKFEDLKVKSGYNASKTTALTTSNLVRTGYVYEFNSTIQDLLDGAGNWAIGDAEGNLYIACNSNENGFKVISRHFRPGLRIIGENINEYTGFAIVTIATDMQASGDRVLSNNYSGAVQVSIVTDMQAQGVYAKDSVGTASVNIATDLTASGVYFKESFGTSSVNIATDMQGSGVYFKESSGTASVDVVTDLQASGDIFQTSSGTATTTIITDMQALGTR